MSNSGDSGLPGDCKITMEQDIYKGRAYVVETSAGTDIVPLHVAGALRCGVADLLPYLSVQTTDEVWEFTLEKGFFARLSMSGYMDCTDWSGPFDSEEQARRHLEEMYGEDDDMGAVPFSEMFGG